jgi:polyisoprenoid-binding protein YceI
VPLTGWITHAATDGFAPILWPFGQDLPLVAASEIVAGAAGAMHWVFTKILAVSILLHIAGALKHTLIDRDGTLSRMARGSTAPLAATGAAHPRAPAIAAGLIFVAGAGVAYVMTERATAPPTVAPAQTMATAAAGNWRVAEGSLTFVINQMGSQLPGTFAAWTADIQFDDTTGTGTVAVSIDTASLTIGSVSDQAKGPDFLATATHPTATFTAAIAPSGASFAANGSLTLLGITAPLTLPFTLTITGDTAVMQGTARLDRRLFGIGKTYPDEATVGFMADVTVALTATRQ